MNSIETCILDGTVSMLRGRGSWGFQSRGELTKKGTHCKKEKGIYRLTLVSNPRPTGFEATALPLTHNASQNFFILFCTDLLKKRLQTVQSIQALWSWMYWWQ